MSTDPSATEQIAAAIRAEADMASRPAQYDRLNDLADGVEQIAARLDDGLRAGVEALASEVQRRDRGEV